MGDTYCCEYTGVCSKNLVDPCQTTAEKRDCLLIKAEQLRHFKSFQNFLLAWQPPVRMISNWWYLQAIITRVLLKDDWDVKYHLCRTCQHWWLTPRSAIATSSNATITLGLGFIQLKKALLSNYCQHHPWFMFLKFSLLKCSTFQNFGGKKYETYFFSLFAHLATTTLSLSIQSV